jgi:hypothetical protein
MDISHLNTVVGVYIEPGNGYVYKYDAGTLKAYQSGSHASLTTPGPFTQVVTGTSMATASSINFMAWGYE